VRWHGSIVRTGCALLGGLLGIAAGGCNQRGPNRPATFGVADCEPTQLGAVELLDPGAAPRSELRSQVGVGHSERINVEVLYGLGSVRRDTVNAVELPPFVLRIAAGPTVRDVLDPRLIRYPVVVDGVDFRDPKVALTSEMRREMAIFESVAGLRFDIAYDDRGRTRPTPLSIPASTPPRAVRFLDNLRGSLLSVEFPEEPVGVGARWRIRRELPPVDEIPIPIVQTATYTLAERNGSKATLEVSLHQSATPFDLGEYAPGTRIRLQAYETMGIGIVDLDLGRLLHAMEYDATSMVRASHVGETENPVAHAGARRGTESEILELVVADASLSRRDVELPRHEEVEAEASPHVVDGRLHVAVGAGPAPVGVITEGENGSRSPPGGVARSRSGRPAWTSRSCRNSQPRDRRTTARSPAPRPRLFRSPSEDRHDERRRATPWPARTQPLAHSPPAATRGSALSGGDVARRPLIRSLRLCSRT